MLILTHSYSLNALTHLMHPGSDYIVNRQNYFSRTFTVTFYSKRANSTENVIVLAEDLIVEGNENFRLRIVAARFIGQAAAIFRAQDGLTNTFADVIIEDNDCEFKKTQLHHLFANMQLGRGPMLMYTSYMNCILPQL